MNASDKPIIDEAVIEETLQQARHADAVRIRELLSKAREMKGLEMAEVAELMECRDSDLLSELFETARWVKDRIYGSRLVLFAPLYVSNHCGNECLYCAFRAGNREITRRALTQEEIARETEVLIGQGHKRILLVAGEGYPREGFDYILKALDTIYATKVGPGEIRRINVNVAPLTVDQFKQLKAAQIGTYQLFQETYHRPTYARVHVAGKKRDFDWRITAMDRAMQADIDDVGVGVLFGLYDWRFEVMALMQHAAYLEDRFGTGPHTISVPRLEPADCAPVAAQPPAPVSDDDFRKLIAILRLAVPYTGLVLSTRESPQIRREAFELGISQISAGSRTNPGGYAELGEEDAQFQLGDHRSVDEVIRDIADVGYVPSFCTACYRLGRTGADFMDLAKPGDIRRHCEPNALSTFMEYLQDYASPETVATGECCIARVLDSLEGAARKRAEQLLNQVRSGDHDVFV